MAKKKDPSIVWRDRKHHLWFPFSFTSYYISKDRLYTENGFFTSHYDELLLYRIIDIKLKRTFAHKLFGTGTLTLCTKVDTDREVILENVKHPLETKNMISDMVEEIRDRKRVTGKEFFGSGNITNVEFDVDHFENFEGDDNN